MYSVHKVSHIASVYMNNHITAHLMHERETKYTDPNKLYQYINSEPRKPCHQTNKLSVHNFYTHTSRNVLLTDPLCVSIQYAYIDSIAGIKAV